MPYLPHKTCCPDPVASTAAISDEGFISLTTVTRPKSREILWSTDRPYDPDKALAWKSYNCVKSRVTNLRRETQVISQFLVWRWRVYCQIDKSTWYDSYAIILVTIQPSNVFVPILFYQSFRKIHFRKFHIPNEFQHNEKFLEYIYTVTAWPNRPVYFDIAQRSNEI